MGFSCIGSRLVVSGAFQCLQRWARVVARGAALVRASSTFLVGSIFDVLKSSPTSSYPLLLLILFFLFWTTLDCFLSRATARPRLQPSLAPIARGALPSRDTASTAAPMPSPSSPCPRSGSNPPTRATVPPRDPTHAAAPLPPPQPPACIGYRPSPLFPLVVALAAAPNPPLRPRTVPLPCPCRSQCQTHRGDGCGEDEQWRRVELG